MKRLKPRKTEFEDPLEAEVVPEMVIMRPQKLVLAPPIVDVTVLPTLDIKGDIFAATHPIVYEKAKTWLLALTEDEIPSTDALALSLGISAQRLSKFRHANGELDEICNLIETASRERLRVSALKGKVVPQIAALVMKHLGYVERVDITSKGESVNAPPLTDEQRKLLSSPPAL
jgi:hypothetical protein